MIVIAQVAMQGFMAVSKQTSSLGCTFGLGLFTAINPWHHFITITHTMSCKMSGEGLEKLYRR